MTDGDEGRRGRDIEREIRDLVGRMTLEEKAMQLDFYSASDLEAPGAEVDGPEGADRWAGLHSDMERVFAGRGAGASVEVRNAIQAYAVGKTRLGIPFLFSTEALHGVHEPGRTIFPQQIALASAWDPDLAFRTGEAIAAEARSLGFHEAWTPVLDPGRDPR